MLTLLVLGSTGLFPNANLRANLPTDAGYVDGVFVVSLTETENGLARLLPREYVGNMRWNTAEGGVAVFLTNETAPRPFRPKVRNSGMRSVGAVWFGGMSVHATMHRGSWNKNH